MKDTHINGKVPVVYSKEQNDRFDGSIPSMVFVPATSGLLCANYVIKDIIK
jgi:tRNA A37 threonylcarbamoyladenosine dehydratase